MHLPEYLVLASITAATKLTKLCVGPGKLICHVLIAVIMESQCSSASNSWDVYGEGASCSHAVLNAVLLFWCFLNALGVPIRLV